MRKVTSRVFQMNVRRAQGGRFRKAVGGFNKDKNALQSIFKAADASGDGILSSAELASFLSFDKLQAKGEGVSKDTFMRILTPSFRRGPSAASSLAATTAVLTESISLKQYTLMSLRSGVPFVAFGFVDNAM
jgi:hypothetical protein